MQFFTHYIQQQVANAHEAIDIFTQLHGAVEIFNFLVGVGFSKVQEQIFLVNLWGTLLDCRLQCPNPPLPYPSRHSMSNGHSELYGAKTSDDKTTSYLYNLSCSIVCICPSPTPTHSQSWHHTAIYANGEVMYTLQMSKQTSFWPSNGSPPIYSI